MIIAGNFKTNHSRSSALAYCKGLDLFLNSKKAEVFLFPPSTALPYADFMYLKIGAQNAYPMCSGAMTGEIGLEQLEDLGVRTLMIGHSERRMLGEDLSICKKKFDFFSAQGMKLFFCVGEDLKTRKSGKIKEFLSAQLKGIDLAYSGLIVAYEPIWAIGTGVSASLEEISQTHQMLKDLGVQSLIYGGSVSAKNAGEIMALEAVDGVLVGGASLKLESFCEIIEEGEK